MCWPHLYDLVMISVLWLTKTLAEFHRNTEGLRLEETSCHLVQPLLQVGSVIARWSRSIEFWVSPRMETAWPLWATHSKVSFFLCINGIPCISVRAHCLFTEHYWEESCSILILLFSRLKNTNSVKPSLHGRCPSPWTIIMALCWIRSIQSMPLVLGRP